MTQPKARKDEEGLVMDMDIINSIDQEEDFIDQEQTIDQVKTSTKSFDDFYQDFKPASLELLDNRRLANKDYNWRIKNRGLFAGTIMGILIIQNLLIYVLIYIAFFNRELNHLQLILGVLLSGTLVETYFTLNHVVKWLFNDIDYKAMKDF